MNVADYIETFSAQHYPVLFSDECKAALQNVADTYGQFTPDHVSYEIRLDSPGPYADFGFRTRDEVFSHYWLGFDYDNYRSPENLVPCTYLEAAPLDNDAIMGKLLGHETYERMKQPLARLEHLLCGKGIKAFGIGSLDCRKHGAEFVRVEAGAKGVQMVTDIAKSLDYSGSIPVIENALTDIEAFALGQAFMLSFDLFEDATSDKIGVAFFQPRALGGLKQLLNHLTERGLCLPEKGSALVDWARDPMPASLAMQDVHHVKFSFERDSMVSVKAYLRQAEDFLLFWG